MPALLAPVTGGAAPAGARAYDEPFRPQFHFTPARNWMNDPNGLVFHEGEYHLFFQHHPRRRTWGTISWGHAVSTDLVHWRELPVAIPAARDESVWSGSVVVDHRNTTGFGTSGTPAMVAIYTAADPRRHSVQSQALAYSLDRGRTWTRYADNPVLEFGEDEFRDPKVFWHGPTERWIMPVALALRRKVRLYSSPDLKRWTLESEFGPQGAISGVYEVPDLFALEVDGRQRWVLVVSVTPGAPSGGSGTQYFLGDFDGRRFTPDDAAPYRPPGGEVLAGFEGSDLDGWTTTGRAFGTAPARGRLPGQPPVAGFRGRGFATSLRGGAAARGTLTSPAFRIARDHLNLLVGGGDLPRRAGEDEHATVDLLVGGRVVRTTTGPGGHWLDWRSWDVRDLRGSTARVRVVDHAREGELAYLSIDAVTQADRPARPSAERARWVDWGRDLYAAITFDGAPDERRLLVAWMNNWQYAARIPTSPWRGTQSEARELSLERVGGRLGLVQRPAPELEALREERPFRLADRAVTGRVTLTGPGSRGKALDLEATLERGSAEDFGLEVLAGGRQATRIGYDAEAQELYVDRRRSGRTAFSPRFASVSRAPLRLARDGTLRLRVLVDHSSVAVFAEGGRRVLTEQVFPGPRSDRVRVFAEGGRAVVRDLRLWRMRSIWRDAR